MHVCSLFTISRTIIDCKDMQTGRWQSFERAADGVMIGPAGVIPSGGRFQLRRSILNQIISTSPLDSARLALGPGTANIYISSFKQTGLWTWHSQKIHHFIQTGWPFELSAANRSITVFKQCKLFIYWFRRADTWTQRQKDHYFQDNWSGP